MRTDLNFKQHIKPRHILIPVLILSLIPAVGAEAHHNEAYGAPLAMTVQTPGASDSTDNVFAVLWENGEALDMLEARDTLSSHRLDDHSITVNNNDEVEVRIEPSTVPHGYIDDMGIIDLEVFVVDKAESLTIGSIHHSVRASSNLTGWEEPTVGTDTPQVEENQSPVGVRARITNMYDFGSAESQGSNARDFIEEQCLVATKTEVASKLAWSTVAQTFPVKGSKSTGGLTYSQTHSTTYGVAVDAGGVVKADGSKSVSNSWSNEWHKNNSWRSYQLEVRYGKFQHKICGTTRKYTWEPVRETGGNKTIALTSRPDYKNCSTTTPDSTFKRNVKKENAYSSSIGVKFKQAIGVDLSVNSDYGESKTVFYYSDVKRTLCGNNDFPAHAGNIIMK